MKKTIHRRGETTYKETAFGIIPRLELIPLEIEGIKKAWDFIMDKSKKGVIPITVNLLMKTHKVGFGWIFKEIGGRFRTIDVTVSHHKPPNFYLVPQLMKDFLADIKMRIRHLPDMNNPQYFDSLTELLAWSHHRFLWIHPFVDYNGRVGRLLTNIILLNLNLPPIELKVETEKGRTIYIKALADADNGNYKDLKKLMRSAIEEAVQQI